MRFLESDTKNLLKHSGISVTEFYSLKCSENINEFVGSLKGQEYFLKPYTYERGKERFGEIIKVLRTEAVSKCQEIFDKKITDPTTEKTISVEKILFEEVAPSKMMFYLSVFFDGSKAKTVFLVSKNKLYAKDLVSEEDGDHLVVKVDFASGFTPFIGRKIAYFLGMDNEAVKKSIKTFKEIYEFFLNYDLKVMGLGPVFLNENNEIIVSGAQMAMDKNSLYRHKDILSLGTDEDAVIFQGKCRTLIFQRLCPK